MFSIPLSVNYLVHSTKINRNQIISEILWHDRNPHSTLLEGRQHLGAIAKDVLTFSHEERKIKGSQLK